ncbi:MAG: hypothetical protein GF364_15820 [Candidatus Lokiarchaeota archaeon]|nr:hypothetical protein [Candidatus Lokiarchaeota archaeon]
MEKRENRQLKRQQLTETTIKFLYFSFIGALLFSYIIICIKWDYYIPKGILYLIGGISLGILIVFTEAVIEIYIMRKKKDCDSDLTNKLQIFRAFLSITALVAVLYILIDKFLVDWVYTRWSEQAEMNIYLLVTSLSISFLFGHSIFSGLRFRMSDLKPVVNRVKTGVLTLALFVLIMSFPIISISLDSQNFLSEQYFWDDGPWLTYDGDPAETMTISWLTNTKQTTEIYFGSDSNNLEKITIANEKSHLHHAKINGLSPDTTYNYVIPKVRFPNYEVGQLHEFHTASSIQEDFSFAVVGDMQPYPGHIMDRCHLVAEGIAEIQPNFVCSLGDISDFGFNLGEWHKVMDFLPKYTANRPFQAVIGNHDHYRDEGFNYRNAFPYNFNSTVDHCYSFDYLNVHISMVDVISSTDEAKTHRESWLRQDIINSKNQGAKWNFIMFHYHVLTSAGRSPYRNLLAWITPIATEFEIDGIMFGHEHQYDHWEYVYGNDSLIFNDEDESILTGNPVHYWCLGTGGANSNVAWNLLDQDPQIVNYYFYNYSSDESQTLSTVKKPWNDQRYLVNASHDIYSPYDDTPIYYHAPEIESYCAKENDYFGFDYGEQSINFMEIKIDQNGNRCTISVRYPNGDILMGPEDNYKQQWIIVK